MKKFFKWIVGAIFILLLVAVLALTLFLNPAVQKMRPAITSKLSELTKSEVKIGDISLRIFPRPKLELSELQIGGKEGLSLVKLVVDAKLGQILSGKIAVSEMIIDSPSLTVTRTMEGITKIGPIMQWPKGGTPADSSSTNVVKDPNQKDALPIETKENKNSDGASGKIDFAIQRLEIANGSLKIIDQTLPFPFEMVALNAKVENISLNTPLVFDVDFRSNLAKSLSASGSLIASSLLTKSPNLNVRIKAQGVSVDRLQTILVQRDPSLASQLKMAGIANFSTSVIAQNAAPKIAAELDVTDSELSYRLNTSSPPVFFKRPSIPLKTSLSIEKIGIDSGDISAFDIKLGENLISGSAKLSANGYSANTTLDKFSLAELGRFISLPVKLVGNVSGQIAVLQAGQKAIAVSGKLTLNSVEASKDGFEIKDINGGVNLNSNRIEAEKIDFIFKEEKFLLNGNLLTRTETADNITGLEVAGLGGKITVNLESDNQHSDKPFRARIEASGVDIKRLLAVAKGDTPFGATGILRRFNTNLVGSFANIKQTLSGPLELELRDGEVLGANLFAGILQKLVGIPGISDSFIALVPQRYRPLVSAVNSTQFNTLEVSTSLSRGTTLNVERVNLEHEAYTITGSGAVNTSGKLELKTQMRLKPSLTSEMVTRSQKLKLLLDREGNLTFPVIISKDQGPIVIVPDLNELGKNALRAGAKEAASKALDKIVPGLGKGTKGLLEDLF